MNISPKQDQMPHLVHVTQLVNRNQSAQMIYPDQIIQLNVQTSLDVQTGLNAQTDHITKSDQMYHPVCVTQLANGNQSAQVI